MNAIARALVVSALAAVLGCASAARPGWVEPGRAAARSFEGIRAPDAQPDPDNPFTRDVRAEAVLGRLGLATARVRTAALRAREKRDVVMTACLDDKVRQLEALEQRARDRHTDLRNASMDEGNAADVAWSEIASLEPQATSIASTASQCVGLEGGEVGGLTYGVRLRDLEVRTEELKENVFRSRTRTALLSDAVLAGGAPARQLAAQTTVSSGSSATGVSFHGPAPAALPNPIPAQVAPAPGRAATPPAVAPGAAHDASMLLRSAQLTLAVFEVDKKMDAVAATAQELGGYLALRGDRELTVRVPKDRFDEALKRIEKLGDVLHRSVAAEDVTDQYVDLELRLKNAYGVRARLEKLLESATVKDAIEIQKELAKVTEEIERFEGKLKLLKDRIAFSTITVTFERTEPQKVRTQALLPFAWMRTLGLGPLLQVAR